MAGDVQRAEKYIVNIPYSVLLSIYQSLDADKGWERLGELIFCVVSINEPHNRCCQLETHFQAGFSRPMNEWFYVTIPWAIDFQ